jgi:hypothetical protein
MNSTKYGLSQQKKAYNAYENEVKINIIPERNGSSPKLEGRSSLNSRSKGGKSSVGEFIPMPINGVDNLRIAYLPKGTDPQRFKRRAGS